MRLWEESLPQDSQESRTIDLLFEQVYSFCPHFQLTQSFRAHFLCIAPNCLGGPKEEVVRSQPLWHISDSHRPASARAGQPFAVQLRMFMWNSASIWTNLRIKIYRWTVGSQLQRPSVWPRKQTWNFRLQAGKVKQCCFHVAKDQNSSNFLISGSLCFGIGH